MRRPRSWATQQSHRMNQPQDFLLDAHCQDKCSLLFRLPGVTCSLRFPNDTPAFLCQSHFFLGGHMSPLPKGRAQPWSLGRLVMRCFGSCGEERCARLVSARGSRSRAIS